MIPMKRSRAQPTTPTTISRQLQAADPDHDSVTAVAYRWGFSSPSRFATYYRRAYGVPPSQTLRN